MSARRCIIVGGVAGGAAAATRLRRLDGNIEIVLFEMGASPSFANCGMPYYLGGAINDRAKLLVTSVDSLRNVFNIDVRVQSRVEKLDRENKTVEVTELTTGRKYYEKYDVLIMATGAAPRTLPFPGRELPGVFTLRDLTDMDNIYANISSAPGSPITIIGAGYIGLELADVLSKKGYKVTVVEFLNQVLGVFDYEMVKPVQRELASMGVQVHLSDSVDKVTKADDGSLLVHTKAGLSIPSHAVIVSIGVKPSSELAAAAGIKCGAMGGILVDEHMRTNDSDIYAVGDVVEVHDFVTGTASQIPLAGPAARQARTAADCICGRNSKYRGTQGTAILSVGKLEIGMTGPTEKTLKRMNIPYMKVFIHPNSHAGYYPGAKTLDVKLLFTPKEGKILGVQAVGEEAVDKIIDGVAMAIQGKMTVFDLEEAELAYAPQFGSAKSPVNMIGFVAAGVLRGDQTHCFSEDLPNMQNIFLLDVRSPAELPAQGTVPDAVNIPLPTLRKNLDKIPKDKKVVTICRVGQRAYNAAVILRQNGFDAEQLSGGILTYNNKL